MFIYSNEQNDTCINFSTKQWTCGRTDNLQKKMFSVNFCVFFGFLQRNSLTLIVGVLCNGRIIKRVNHDYGTPFRQILIIATVPKRMKKLGT